jgi:predicted nucleic-acid-binding protein
MRAIDTNVLLRYLRDDDVEQSARARRLIDEEASLSDPLLVGTEVLVEIGWYMARRLKLSRAEMVAVFLAVLDNAHLRVAEALAVEAAVDAFATGPAGFVDYLIAAAARARGAEFTFTYDRDAAGHDGFRLLTSGDR